MPKLQVDKALIRELSQLLDETNLTEIELCEGSKSVRVVRTAAAPMMAAAPALQSVSVAAPADSAAASSVRANAADEPGAVRSPMVGTVYLSAEPGGVPFVKVGDTVAQGQTLLIIEAMKVMNSDSRAARRHGEKGSGRGCPADRIRRHPCRDRIGTLVREGSDRQQGRDRPPNPSRLPRNGHTDGRRALDGRRRRDACTACG